MKWVLVLIHNVDIIVHWESVDYFIIFSRLISRKKPGRKTTELNRLLDGIQIFPVIILKKT